jgi:hypothetical protein
MSRSTLASQGACKELQTRSTAQVAPLRNFQAAEIFPALRLIEARSCPGCYTHFQSHPTKPLRLPSP